MDETYNELKVYLTNNFNDYLSSVSKELIDYYGIKYKDIILERLNNTSFIFYINEEIRSLRKFKGPKTLKSEYKKINTFYSQVIRYITRLNKDKELEESKIINSKIFDTTNYEKFTKQDLIDIDSILYYSFAKNNICFIPQYLPDSGAIEHQILIPLFAANDEALIHEIVHSIMAQDLLINVEEEDIYVKTGIGVDDETEALLEECFTEIDAQNIYTRLLKKNINFIDRFYPRTRFHSSYNTFIPFVEDFYYSFQDEINYSRITLNKNYLLELIGRDNYYAIIDDLKDCYKNYFEKEDYMYYKSIFDKDINKAKKNYKVKKLI